MKVIFRTWHCRTMWTRYVSSGAVALRLVSQETGTPIATCTINIAGLSLLSPSCLFIKDWSENSGMVEALQAAGILRKDTEVTRIPVSPFYSGALCNLTAEALAEMRNQLGPEKRSFDTDKEKSA